MEQEIDKKYPEKDSEKYFIIGKPVNKEKAEKLGIMEKIGKGEVLIEIPKKIIDDMRK